MDQFEPMTQGEFGKLIDVSQQTISLYIAEGKIPASALVDGGRLKKINPVKAIAALARGLNPAQGKKGQSAEGDPDGSFADAKLWSIRYESALRKLNFQTKEKKYILKAEVRQQAFQVIRAVREHIGEVGPRVLKAIEGKKDRNKVLEIFNLEVNRALKETCKALIKLS